MSHPQPSSAAEELLSSLAGVVSAHVVTQDDDPVEIHILSSAELHPKQVVRNVESALSAGLGMKIDRRIVSVAQVKTPGAAPVNGSGPGTTTEGDRPNGQPDHASTGNGRSALPGGARLEYVRFESRRNAETCECRVVLRESAREFIGSAEGPDTTAGRAEAAARGVLNAIGEARPGIRMDLQGATVSASRGRTYVIVSAIALLDRQTVSLAGAAPLARSPEEAGILATLQATNRWSG
ncbi:MAG TPA: hypothetical protein VK966_07420 [Longimicrobiales bacterium]|nr:hypothetical protein [Longimicrobiales bacterium]